MPVADIVTMEETNRLLGLCLSDKKFHKLKWDDLVIACRARGYEPRKVDVEKPLEEQGSLTVFIHKLTDTLAAADHGDAKSKEIIKNVEQYISNHTDMIVIDPIDNVRILLDRFKYYSLLEKQPTLLLNGVFTPSFCMLNSNNHNDHMNAMQARGVTFPLVCKTLLAHGAKSAHRMSVIFNEAGLAHCKTPCVLQSFINHNAVLYKVFLVGNRYHIVERPSLKNFYACSERESIHFNSGEVCKADSQSTLSILDPHEITEIETNVKLDKKKIETIIKVLRKELNLMLFGIDIVIDKRTNNYAIIDINFYPGYEGFPNFFYHLVDCIDDLVNKSDVSKNSLKVVTKNIDGLTDKNNCDTIESGLHKPHSINFNMVEIDSVLK